MSIPPAPKTAQKEMGASRVRPPGSSEVSSSGSHTSGGPMASSSLEPRTSARPMMPLGSRNYVLAVPPLDVVGFPVVLRSSSDFKASMVRGMLYSSLQGMRGCSLSELEERMEVFRACVDLADRQSLVQQRTQERARLVSEQDSLSTEVTNLSEELEEVKAEMDELQAWMLSLSACRDTSWEALHQRSCELEQLDFDSAAVTSSDNLIAQEISHLQEEKQTLLRRAEELKAMIEDSLDRF
ncbi:hypothetical protein AMTR_s00076p00081190 [Amborella trichopoda]|uniref:Uncharacterized protein n=1 Tax=Amborella trichopoda TaxID=13333 RepID=W1P474_AMBTC|nr:hypothetical protein AMTR_s00076p00081190 [Amborella trichopoda]